MANGLNKVQLIGNLGKDPEVKVFEGDRKRVSFSLATSRTYKSREGLNTTKTEWHNIVLWSPTAEIAERFLTKGSQVYIEGEINNRSYETNTGEKRYITEINGRQLLLLGRGAGAEANTAMDSESSPMSSSDIPNADTTAAPVTPTTNKTSTLTNEEEPDNTLPF
ncbi:MAG: single-stranded DNA-binding protein [Bacteroidota bacterium]